MLRQLSCSLVWLAWVLRVPGGCGVRSAVWLAPARLVLCARLGVLCFVGVVCLVCWLGCPWRSVVRCLAWRGVCDVLRAVGGSVLWRGPVWHGVA